MNKFQRLLAFIFLFYIFSICVGYIGGFLYVDKIDSASQDYNKPNPLYPFDVKQNMSEVKYKILRRTKDGAIFLVVDEVPYHINSLEACPSLVLNYENVESPSRLDNVCFKINRFFFFFAKYVYTNKCRYNIYMYKLLS